MMVLLYPEQNLLRAKINQDISQTAFAHLRRYCGLAAPEYSCAPKCLANERMLFAHRVKNF